MTSHHLMEEGDLKLCDIPYKKYFVPKEENPIFILDVNYERHLKESSFCCKIKTFMLKEVFNLFP